MNTKFLIIRSIYENPKISQREIAKKFSVSLGKINSVIKEAESDGYLLKKSATENAKTRHLSGEYLISDKGKALLEENKVDAAIIFACGMGLHLAPLTYDTPKSFIKIKGELMIERQIEQLKSVGIDDITIMVGYLKEKFDYLVDKYNVKLIYNEEYKEKNTLATFYHAIPVMKGKNIYVCVSDVYMSENIYHTYECEQYFIGTFREDCMNEWRCIINSKNELRAVEIGGTNDYCMLGISFLTKEFLDKFIPLVEKFYYMTMSASLYWEDVIMQNYTKLPCIYIYKIDKNIIYEFDTINDIKNFDKISNDFVLEITNFVTKVFKVDADEVSDIECIKDGITNRSYKFKLKNEWYIARVPYEGTEKYINRKNECEIYKLLADKNITDKVVYFDENTGYRICKYFVDAKTLDINNENELFECMKNYKKLHSLDIKIKSSCDIIDKIHEYLDIIKKKEILVQYEDFDTVIKNAKSLEYEVRKIEHKKVLCHGYPTPENILFTKEGLKFIDFEYAGMADPVSEIALFGVSVGFDIKKTYELYKIYSSVDILDDVEKKLIVYYMALGGLYCTLWAITRESLGGVDYGIYGMKNYRVFKQCFEYIQKEISNGIFEE